MILTCAFLDQGFELRRPSADGPDIHIASQSERPTIWVEAVTIELGTGGDHAGRVEYQKVDDGSTSFGLFNTKPDKTALRNTSALASKAKQHREFVDRGVVATGDIFVVAINGALLHDYSSDDTDPEILKSVYPIDDAYVAVAVAVGHPNPPPPQHGYRYRGQVTKASGTEIPLTAS